MAGMCVVHSPPALLLLNRMSGFLFRVSGRFCPRINCRAKREHIACARAYALVVAVCATCCSGGCVHDLV
uniref:Uncharacterized protein n=1 Tax=Candidatus Methanophaga sp. ANME-1 ERB7 TaxID=2759913 RepID=A0A7G9ZDA8_9EURY|nr:hypothetical protein DKLEMCON_00024 [Methanosarcinales archaeon ANME-1 ERB7]